MASASACALACTLARDRASAKPLVLRAFLSSSNSIQPLPSTSMLSKSASTSFFGASYPSAAIPRRISFLSSAPLPSSSHSRNRSISLTPCSLSTSCSCSCTLFSPSAASRTAGGSADTRADT